MATGLIQSLLAPKSATQIATSSPNTQTTTPAVQKTTTPTPLNSNGQLVSNALGLKANSPTTVTAPPANTLTPKQTADPVTYIPPSASTGTTGNNSSVLNVPNGQGGYTSGTPAAVASAIAPSPAALPANPTPQPTNPTPDPTSPTGIIGGLLNTTAANQTQQATAAQQVQQLAAQYAQQEAALTGGYSGIGGADTNARIQQLEQFKNSAIGAIQQEQAALSGYQTQAQGAASTALNALTTTTAAPYGQPIYQPATGSFVSSGGSGAGGSLQLSGVPANDINMLATAVTGGTIDYSSALSQLSGYGTAIQNQLLPAIQKLNPTFSVNASNASANTTATGQQLQTAAASANQALDTLSSAFTSLGSTQTGGIPITNSIANWIGTQLGQSALTSYKTALADARSQLVGVLNTSGGTPTGNEATAEAYLPDDMTVAQFNQNVGTVQNPGVVRTLIQQKVNSFTGSGQQNNQPQNAPAADTSPSSSDFNW